MMAWSHSCTSNETNYFFILSNKAEHEGSAQIKDGQITQMWHVSLGNHYM